MRSGLLHIVIYVRRRLRFFTEKYFFEKFEKIVDKACFIWYYNQAAETTQDLPEWRNWQTHRT